MLGHIFSTNKYFSSYKRFEDIYKLNREKIHLKIPKRYTIKNNDKTQDNETIITQNIFEVLIDSDESDTHACDNDNDELSNNVSGIASPQVNLRNDNAKKYRHKHKNKSEKK